MFPISDSIKSEKFPFFNIVLIVITTFVFFLQVISPNPDAFIAKYALIPSNVNFSILVTLLPFITAIFLHGGFLHIISNMWFLWVFGDDVEGTFGSILFLILYFAGGVVGNITQFILMPHSSIPMLGASGAIAGVLGAYFILFPYSKIKTLVPIFLFLTFIDIPAPIMLGYWFFLQVISGAVSLPGSDLGGIAFFAHVGGFVTGVLFALTFGTSRKGNIVYE